MKSLLLGKKEPLDRHFIDEIVLEAPVHKVFKFFSDAKNLERLTPPWLNFKVLSQSTPQIQEGTLFDYQLRIRGVPVKWRTRIESWQSDNAFVDTQLIGPYQKWYHLHVFTPEADGRHTRMRDEVLYRLPFGTLGNFFGGWFVDREVQTIFRYRVNSISDIFKSV